MDPTHYDIAATPYANSMPLAQFIPQACPQATVLWGTAPAQLAERVLQGTADAGLVPVIELLTRPELTMVEGVGICARRQVLSVLLKCRVPLAQVRCVAADPASRTSNALARLLLRRHLKRDVPVVPAGNGKPDAAVVIGDRALTAPPAPAGDYDLAELWWRMTGLPFVFAVWAIRRDHPFRSELTTILLAARRLGMDAVEQIAGEQARKLGLDAAFCRHYLTKAIHYEIGDEEQRAITLFSRLLVEDGLIALPAAMGTEVQQ